MASGPAHLAREYTQFEHRFFARTY